MNTEIISLVQSFLEINQFFVYLILFFGSFFDAIIGLNLLIYGEIFFLAGGILAGFGNLNIHAVFFIALFGVILGDNFSYWIGKKFGKRLFKEHKKIFTLKLYFRGKKVFDKYGDKSVFLARIFGIFSWVTPFLAGIFKIEYRRFFLYDFLGSIIGIGQFILIGYFLGYNYESVINLINNYFVILFLIIAGILLLVYLMKKTKLKFMLIDSKRKFFAFIIKYFCFYVIILSSFYIMLLYFMFFVFVWPSNKDFNNDIYQINHKLENIVGKYKLDITEDKEAKKVAQKANVVYIGNDLEKNMEKVGWVKNVNFSDEGMTLWKYTYLTLKKIAPVSDQYLFGKRHDLAFQNKNATITERNHIRFWHIGFTARTRQKIYIGAASLDNGATLRLYRYLIVPFHSVDINLDKSRDLIMQVFLENDNTKEFLFAPKNIAKQAIKTLQNNSNNQKNVNKLNFVTDNKILIIKEK
ncbi:MAG: LssY C-terminal domain-containing protein [Candidatus Gracilibacteria bacterium]|nr:LssY C-terminal domain-containing protein [Candidatus Gracilibacteria bacterium]